MQETWFCIILVFDLDDFKGRISPLLFSKMELYLPKQNNKNLYSCLFFSIRTKETMIHASTSHLGELLKLTESDLKANYSWPLGQNLSAKLLFLSQSINLVCILIKRADLNQ